MGKKTPFYRRGKIQPLCAQPAHERYYRSGGRSREKEQPSMNLGAVVPLISGTTAHPSGTTAGGAEHGTQKNSSGTTARPERYYRLQAVLPPIGAVLPLIGGTAVPYCRATTAKLDTKNARPKIEAVPARNRSRTTAYGHRRYYRFEQQYYRLGR